MSAPTPAPPSQQREGGEPPESLLASFKGLVRELPGLVSDRVELLSLEISRAGLALLQIVCLTVALAILGVTAWLALWAGIAAMLVTFLDLHWVAALFVVLGVNALAAWWAVAKLISLLPLLSLPATRRHLTINPLARHAGEEAPANPPSASEAASSSAPTSTPPSP